MKNPHDPRHLHRLAVVKSLFSWDFHAQQKISPADTQKIIKKIKKIDKIICRAAPEWPIAQINHIDLAILRLAIYEMVLAKIDPPKVIIDEAVEIAKHFGADKSPKFVNGVLGSVLNESNKPG